MKKAFLRTEYLQKRKELTQDQVDEYNNAIVENIASFLAEQSIKTIHIFLPQHSKNEIDTWKIISFLNLHFPDIQIVAPRIISGTKELEHYLLTPETELINNRWKIPEPDPDNSTKIEPYKIDVVLIPLLAFDKKGFRVGYGGGYYDRFLAQCQPDILKIGLSFFEAINEINDIDPFDVAMDYCITPLGIVRF